MSAQVVQSSGDIRARPDDSAIHEKLTALPTANPTRNGAHITLAAVPPYMRAVETRHKRPSGLNRSGQQPRRHPLRGP
jgi:hypothetical protein